MTDCLSINHNWIHRHGARWPLVRLSECAAAIRASLPADDADDAELVGSLLRRRVGYDLSELQQLYDGIAARRGGDDAAVARTLAGEVAALLARATTAPATPSRCRSGSAAVNIESSSCTVPLSPTTRGTQGPSLTTHFRSVSLT